MSSADSMIRFYDIDKFNWLGFFHIGECLCVSMTAFCIKREANDAEGTSHLLAPPYTLALFLIFFV